MKRKLVKIVRILSVDTDEILIDIQLSFVLLNSIEIIDDEDLVIHHFPEDEDLDIEYMFDELSKDDQKVIYQTLSRLLYN